MAASSGLESGVSADASAICLLLRRSAADFASNLAVFWRRHRFDRPDWLAPVASEASLAARRCAFCHACRNPWRGITGRQGRAAGQNRPALPHDGRSAGGGFGGAPSSRKGHGHCGANLLNWSGSLVCIDIKRENWELTAGYRAHCGQACYLFDPFAEDGRTTRWNPFTYVSEDPRRRLNDLQRIAEMLYPDPPNVDPFGRPPPDRSS